MTNKDTTLPKYLVRFCTINSNNLNCLRERKIYIPSPEQLNDPTEGVIGRSILLRYRDGDDSAAKKKDDHIKLLQKSGVYCCSKLYREASYFAQWAYYGDSHQGMALILKPKENSDFSWREVTYEKPPLYESSEYCDDSEYIRELLIHKHPDWKQEAEWRIVFPGLCEVKKSEKHFFDLKAIVFGYRTPKDQQRRVLESIRDRLLDENNELLENRVKLIWQQKCTHINYKYQPFRHINYRDHDDYESIKEAPGTGDKIKRILDPDYFQQV